ncbi:MAG: hypothetical protein AB7S38_14425 [Vulcanimicrobiota bacterium]
MIIYPLVNARDGRKRGEFPVGRLDWDGETVSIDCRDRHYRQALEKLFLNPLRIRIPVGGYETALGHRWAELLPGTDEHFLECLRRVSKLGLVVDYGD